MRPIPFRRALAGATLLAASIAALAAPSFQEDSYGTNKRLYEALKDNPYFQALPDVKHTLCKVSHKDEGLAVYEHLPLGQGVVGTIAADFTKFTDDKLTGEPHMQSGAFGGIILLRGTAAPSHAFSYTGDSMFPLLDGKSFRMSVQRQNSRLEYSCRDRYAPAAFQLAGVRGRLHLVSCERRTVKPDGDWTPEKSSHALCAQSLGFCPLHWVGEDGHKGLFEHFTAGGEKFSPVTWECQSAR